MQGRGSKRFFGDTVIVVALLIKIVKLMSCEQSAIFFQNLAWMSQITPESGINIGVCLLFFEKIGREKNEKLPQCLDWCKNESKLWFQNFKEGGTTFIKGDTSIPDSRVLRQNHLTFLHISTKNSPKKSSFTEVVKI